MQNEQEKLSQLKSEDKNFENFLTKEEMYYELANFYRAQKKYVDAVYFIRKEIDRESSLSYQVCLADCYIEQGCYEQSLLFLNQILESPQVTGRFSYVVSLLKLECLVNIGQLEEALLFIRLLKGKHEVEEELLAWQAVTYLKSNKITEAQKCYSNCLSLNNQLEKAWIGLGSIHCIKGDFELGVSCFKRALDYDPYNIAALKLKRKYEERAV